MARARSMSLAFTALAVAAVAIPWVAQASDPFLVAPAAEIVERSPAFRYANMGAQAALDELDRRKILYQQVEPHGAVRTPIRLTGKLHGVHIHSALPENERPTTPFEICDARLALALDDFAALLARRDIVELVHFTMYRPSTERALSGGASKLVPDWVMRSDLGKKSSSAKAAGRSRAGGRRGAPSSGRKGSKGKRPVRDSEARPAVRLNAPQSRHPLGLAIDPGVFIKRDGSVLSVAAHFRGTIGAQTCGPGASAPQDPRARELWSIVCETYDAKIFTYVLTPNFDRPHQDHFHMDIKPEVRWFLYH